MARRNAGNSAIAVALLATATLSCQTSLGPELPEAGGDVLVEFGHDLARWPRGAWRLEDAQIRDDSLVLTFDHSGGCAEHRYWLLAVDDFTILPTAGPLPVASVPLQMAHDDGGDMCEALLTRVQSWNLAPLLEEYHRRFGDGLVILQLRVPQAQGSLAERTVSWGP